MLTTREATACARVCAQVELRAPEKHVGPVLKELTGKRRADVRQLVAPNEHSADRRHLVQAEVPLANLIGYADAVRSLTQGEAALSMEFERYRPIDSFAFEEARKAMGMS